MTSAPGPEGPPVFDTVLNGKSVLGSIVGTRADLQDVFALHVAGRTRVSYETRPLSAVNEAFDEVLAGKARARLVLQPCRTAQADIPPGCSLTYDRGVARLGPPE